MKLIINLLLFAIAIPSFAQKKLIDNETPKNWEKLEAYQISDKGDFVWYRQRSPAKGGKIILTSSDGKYKRIFKDGNQPKFTDGGNYFICNYNGSDTTQIVALDTKREFILKGRSYAVAKSKKGDLIACQSNRQLTVMNTKLGDKHIFTGVVRFEFSQDGSTIMLARQVGQQYFLISISTSDYKEQVINEGNVGNWCFDPAGKTFAYLTKESSGNQMWIYSLTNKINRQVKVSSLGSNTKISDDMLNLSPDGNILYFNVEKQFKQQEPNVITDRLNVWNYKDEYPQSNQLLGNMTDPSRRKQSVVYNIASSKITTITGDNLKILDDGKYNNEFVLLGNQVYEKEPRDRGLDRKMFLMNVGTGEKKLIATNPSDNRPAEITGDESFVIWYDEDAHRYFSYETRSGLRHDLSSSIPYSMDTFKDPKKLTPGHSPYGYSLIQIGSKTESLIISDEYDLWEVDMSGNKKPICLTGGIGRKQSIRFTLLLGDKARNKKSILVEGFNTQNKDKGIFSLSLNNRLELEMKEIAPMQATLFSGYFVPQIAKNAEISLLPQQKANKSINLYVYHGGHSLKITDFHQEDEYNWFTSELHTYKLADGSSNDGILYKPGDFNPSKKYPVIFYYYQLNSHLLNRSIEPTLSEGLLPIPWFVSNGYLVFVPDVTHEQPNPGDRISDCIISAAKYVAELTYVDAKCMGLQGHSYGGYETNLIITKSNLFAAAQSSSGISNVTSEYGTPIFGGTPGYHIIEEGQFNMPGTLWQYREQYIKDSPVFNAEKVTTPLLMMHGTQDIRVPFAQSVEMYFALRRLNKPVWLLEYEDEEHYLMNENNLEDFTIRQQQFFDHYLKGKAMPVWMSRGIQSWEKGIKSGLESDTAQESK
jgi:dipeptidyl aminopeptidase/acylaminoacyl peptidase